jgi:prolyl oligopeptidase PreP (S9A serine peptidase family)
MSRSIEPDRRGAVSPHDEVTDTYGKVTVTDDYRWLENFDDPAVKQWADAQNAAARSLLDALPDRDALAASSARSSSRPSRATSPSNNAAARFSP